MTYSIYDAYNKSVEYVKNGKSIPEAIYLTLMSDIDYDHDPQQMLLYWHAHRVPPFVAGKGYPRTKENEHG